MLTLSRNYCLSSSKFHYHGIVHVTARDLETNKAANISIEGSSNMSQRQIEAATKRLTDGR